MAVLPIVTIPDPVLRTQAEPIDTVTDEIRTLANDMAETMYVAPGIGLAAPQVGVSKRLIVVDVAHQDEPAQLYQMINPVITVKNGQTVSEEGCLSVPGYFETVQRAQTVTVEYTDLDGQHKTVNADGMLAICLQHEIDHLNGVVFIDYLSSLKKKAALRKVKQITENQA